MHYISFSFSETLRAVQNDLLNISKILHKLNTNQNGIKFIAKHFKKTKMLGILLYTFHLQPLSHMKKLFHPKHASIFVRAYTDHKKN
jgi:NRPS condensation-like uncharacterized protein